MVQAAQQEDISVAVKSLSATKDQAKDFSWFSFNGARAVEVSQRTHKRKIEKGQKFGLRPARGNKYYLIFPDMVHVDFPIEAKLGASLMTKSAKLRKVPELKDSKDTVRVRGIKSTMRTLMKTQFDSPRFSPRGVKSEKENGYDYSNYQWRQVVDQTLVVKHSKGQELLRKYDSIGMRFLKETRGGILIRPDGLRLIISTEEYDRLVKEIPILPIKEWPNGVLTLRTINAYKKSAAQSLKLAGQELQEAKRLERLALKAARERAAKELREAKKREKEAEKEALEELKRKLKEKDAAQDMPRSEDARLEDHRKALQGEDDDTDFFESEFEEDLDDSELEFGYEADEGVEDMDLEDIFRKRQFSADSVGIEDTFKTLFGDADEVEGEADPDFDMSALEEDDDEDEEDHPSPKKVKRKKETKEADTEASDDLNDEASDDLDDDEDDDGDIDEDDLDEDAPEEEEEEDDSSEDEDFTEDDEVDVDETEAGEDEDADVVAAEEESQKTAKDYAKANKNTPSKAGNPEEGDVLNFKSDTRNRDWLIVKVSSHAASANIVVYTVYDLTTSPEEVRQVRINQGRGRSLFDIATHKKDMKPQLFNRVYDMVEMFDVNKDPIGG